MSQSTTDPLRGIPPSSSVRVQHSTTDSYLMKGAPIPTLDYNGGKGTASTTGEAIQGSLREKLSTSELRPPHDSLYVPRISQSDSKATDSTTEGEEEEAKKPESMWDSLAVKVRNQDEATAKAWKEEIDALLVFAGLFSAVLTAFNVDLYKALKPDPSPDMSAQSIALLISLMNNVSVPPVLAVSTDAAQPSASSVWINALWFSALVLSLSSASIGIVIRQWLNHFLSPVSDDGERKVYIHCLRWDMGIVAWYVPEILSILPILLQLALALFFIGLIILLWTLNTVVAAITTALVSALLLFSASSMIIPAFYPYCPYKSPQSLLTCRAIHWIMRQAPYWWRWASFHVAEVVSSVIREKSKASQGGVTKGPGLWEASWRVESNWIAFEQREIRLFRNGALKKLSENVFVWINKLLMGDPTLVDAVTTCLLEHKHVPRSHPQGTDQPLLNESTTLTRLQRMYTSKQALSGKMRASLARLVLRMLPTVRSPVEIDGQHWEVLPYVLSAKQAPVSELFQYLAERDLAWQQGGRLQMSTKTDLASRFVDKFSQFEGLHVLKLPGEPVEGPMAREYLAYIIKMTFNDLRLLGRHSIRVVHHGKDATELKRDIQHDIRTLAFMTVLIAALPASYHHLHAERTSMHNHFACIDKSVKFYAVHDSKLAEQWHDLSVLFQQLQNKHPIQMAATGEDEMMEKLMHTMHDVAMVSGLDVV
ncbi:hypothetical protein OBBRIDRAFT_796604 [Obba rivulosa]|uniref:DUF6535 domain-containing protein n=1 Tax=Obba rivulosa TaxID=1052685 RepID=A0A8E2DGE9_9APHY|nr:hypothetical protein OBBRIDRAFT_796604 [Obba rivulosa]